MYLDLEMCTAEDYFNNSNDVIDYDENGSGNISMDQAHSVQKILSIECSIYALRRCIGDATDGSVIDVLVDLRREHIDMYQALYGQYIEYRNFY